MPYYNHDSYVLTRYAEFHFRPHNPTISVQRISECQISMYWGNQKSSGMDLRDSGHLLFDAAGVATTPEAQSKDGFCATAERLLGKRIAMSSEWSNDGDRRIDCRVVKTEWGIELLRNGDRLA